jgi:hypothetical protein
MPQFGAFNEPELWFQINQETSLKVEMDSELSIKCKFLHLYNAHFKFCFHHCVIHDEMNKIRSHLHIFLRIFKSN